MNFAMTIGNIVPPAELGLPLIIPHTRLTNLLSTTEICVKALKHPGSSQSKVQAVIRGSGCWIRRQSQQKI